MKRKRCSIAMHLLLLACFLFGDVHAQEKRTDTVAQKDVTDILKKIFKKKPDTSQAAKTTPGIAILPTLSYNPSFGFMIGAKIAGGKQFGRPEDTDYSIFGLEGVYTTKGIINIQARHNIFIANNKLNWQGNWQIAKYGIIDYGLGTNTSSYKGRGFSINEFPVVNADSAFPIQYKCIRLWEKVYTNIGTDMFVGAGLSFDFFNDIRDEKRLVGKSTPHHRYSRRNDYDSVKYAANGLLVAFQYNTREHPVRSYGGVYFDFFFRFNQTWLGSTKNSIQMQWDLRKYWSLSKRNPEHVIAFWHWASFLLGGSLPYLQLPATATDTYARSGRGFTLSRFKGPSYAYFETEYRFPITRNKLISGVGFLNVQTASDDLRQGVFSYWVPAGGAGLRILFQKQSRTTLCIDIAKGRFGSSGIFFGLNEAF